MDEQPSLQTERLLLRPFYASDAARVQSLAGNPRVAEMTNNIPHPYAEGEAENWIAAQPDDWERGTAAIFAICLRGSDDIIGAMGLMNICNGDAELGYWVGEPWWNNGYASEAADTVVGFGIAWCGLRRIHAHHLTRNPASGKVLKSAGLKRVHKGTLTGRDGSAEEPAEFYELIVTDDMIDDD